MIRKRQLNWLNQSGSNPKGWFCRPALKTRFGRQWPFSGFALTGKCLILGSSKILHILRSDPVQLAALWTVRQLVTTMLGMDKKTKKRLEVARDRLQKLRRQISGAKEQNDEPEHVERLAAEIAKVESEIDRLKAG